MTAGLTLVGVLAAYIAYLAVGVLVCTAVLAVAINRSERRPPKQTARQSLGLDRAAKATHDREVTP